MSAFPGGSAWAMARDIADGFLLVTERTFLRFGPAEIEKAGFEIRRKLRDVRGKQPDLEDVDALRSRNMQIQRLGLAIRVLDAARRKRRM